MKLLSGLAVILALALAGCSSTPEEEVSADAATEEEAISRSEALKASGPAQPEAPEQNAWLGNTGFLYWGDGAPAEPQIHIVRSSEELRALEARAGVALGDPLEADQHATVVFLGPQPHRMWGFLVTRNAVRGDTRTLVLRGRVVDPDDDDDDDLIAARSPWVLVRHRGTPKRHTVVDFEAMYGATIEALPERTLRTDPLLSGAGPLAATAVWGYLGPEDPATRIARTAEEWAALWQSVGREPAIPFAPGAVGIGAFQGAKPTGGYGVEFAGAAFQGGALDVVLREIVPAPDAIVTQAITYPWAIVLVAGAEGAEPQLRYETGTASQYPQLPGPGDIGVHRGPGAFETLGAP